MRSLGRYEIIDQIGAGAMGAVYKARDPLMGRDVAIKTILSHAIEGPQSDEFRERFFREAQAAGRLAHPGIVTVYDVIEHEGAPFLVMEYIAGRTLQSMLQDGHRFDLEQVRDFGVQLAKALNYAHGNGVIHRDIKPANILVTGDNRTKIADFGVAKILESQVTTTGQLLGTPAFMAPEQFTGARVDGRADLFALAVVLYWMTTGDKPFSGDTILSIQYKTVHTDPVPPRKLNPAIPQNFETVILKGLQKNPSDRYQTGEEFARDLLAMRLNGPAVAPSMMISGDEPTLPPMATAASVPSIPAPAGKEAAPSQPASNVDRPRWKRDRRKRERRFSPIVAGLIFLAVLGLFRTFRPLAFGPPNGRAVPEQSAPENPPEGRLPLPPAGPPPKTGAENPRPVTPAANDRVPRPAGVQPGSRAEESALLPPPAEPGPGPDNVAVGRGNRNALGSIFRQRQLAQSIDSSRLLITSPAISDFLTVIVRVDGEVLFRKDATAPVPSEPEQGRRRGEPREGSTVPLSEERLLPAGDHKIQVTAFIGPRRIGRIEEVMGQFKAGQRLSLRIQSVPGGQRAGNPDRGANRFSITLN